MTRAPWAERKVDAICRWTSDSLRALVIKLLLAEHKRAVNAVKREIKRIGMDQHTYTVDQKLTILAILEPLLAALQKGRT